MQQHQRNVKPFRSLHEGAKLYSKEELKHSPSVRAGASPQEEVKLRRTYTRFIKDVCNELKLTRFTYETAVVFCHRYFAERAFQKNDRFLVACACIFLSSKTDDSPRTPSDVAHAYLKLKAANQRNARPQAAEVDEMSAKIRIAEMAVLMTLNFQLQVEYPFTSLMKALMDLDMVNSSVSQPAVNFLNDSLESTVRLQYPARDIGLTALYLASQRMNVTLPLPDGKTFCEHYEISQERLDEIGQMLMERYAVTPGTAGAGAQQQQQQRAQQAGPSAQLPAPASGEAAKEEPEEGELPSQCQPSDAAPAAPSTSAPAPSTSAPAAAGADERAGAGPAQPAEAGEAAAPSTSAVPEQAHAQSQQGKLEAKHDQQPSAAFSGRVSNTPHGLPLEDSANEDGNNNVSAVSPNGVEVQQPASGQQQRAAAGVMTMDVDTAPSAQPRRKRTAEEAELMHTCAAEAAVDNMDGTVRAQQAPRLA